MPQQPAYNPPLNIQGGGEGIRKALREGDGGSEGVRGREREREREKEREGEGEGEGE